MPPKNQNRNHVRFEAQPAVAEEGSSGRAIAVADDVDGESDAGRYSTAGDTVGSEPDDSNGEPAVADNRFLWPKTPVQGNPGASTKRGPSSKYNDEPEVGNFGLMVGNWGARATLGGKKVSRRRQQTSDRQILKSPAQVLVIVESSRALGNLLEQPPMQGSYELTGLDGRDTHEHWVQRGREESAVLIAARKDVADSLECLHHEVFADHPYKEKGKDKMARTRLMVCKVGFKQNIGHLGKDMTVGGVHGHYKTMKIEWPQVSKAFWDRLARHVLHFCIQFLAGDFNMSLTEVCKQLRARGISCNCVAWYPWQKPPNDREAAVAGMDEQRLGIDSLGVFYFGWGSSRNVEISTPWSLHHIDILTAFAGDHKDLDVYEGGNHPGQPWDCYRSVKYKETCADKDLEARLHDLLWLSLTPDQLESIQPREGVYYRAYLRLKQKTTDQKEWLVDGEMHNGAHYPLCVFTHNSGGRSQEAQERRRHRRGWRSEERREGQAGKKGGKKESGKIRVTVTEATYYGRAKGKGQGTGSLPSSSSGCCPAVAESGQEHRGTTASRQTNVNNGTGSLPSSSSTSSSVGSSIFPSVFARSRGNVQEPWRKQESNWVWYGSKRDQPEAVVKEGWYGSNWVWHERWY